MSKKKQTKTVAINIRVTPEVKALAEAEAEAMGRSLTSYLEVLIREAPGKRRSRIMALETAAWNAVTIRHKAKETVTRLETPPVYGPPERDPHYHPKPDDWVPYGIRAIVEDEFLGEATVAVSSDLYRRMYSGGHQHAKPKV
jgi:uncharacterized protein (DUF1778 family)